MHARPTAIPPDPWVGDDRPGHCHREREGVSAPYFCRAPLADDADTASSTCWLRTRARSTSSPSTRPASPSGSPRSASRAPRRRRASPSVRSSSLFYILKLTTERALLRLEQPSGHDDLLVNPAISSHQGPRGFRHTPRRLGRNILIYPTVSVENKLLATGVRMLYILSFSSWAPASSGSATIQVSSETINLASDTIHLAV